MALKNPRDENGPDGYPVDNAAFRAAARKVLEARKADADQARRFRDQLSKNFRSSNNDDGSQR